VPLCMPPSGKIFVPEASTLLCLMAFQFQLSSSCIFRHIWGSQIYTIGPYAPWTPPNGEFFFTRTEYFTISNCVFNFNILAVVVSDILGGPTFTLVGPVPPLRPLAEFFFCTSGEFVSMSNGVFNCNFLALLLNEILGGSQIYTKGPYAPRTPPSGEIFVPNASTSQYLIVFLISTL